jgi:NADH-quinone oxidoreductase subunit L
MTILDYYPLLIILAPLAAALLTALPHGLVGETSYRLGVLCHVVALIVSLQVLRVAAAPDHQTVDLLLFDAAPDTPFRLLFHLDRLAAVMMVVIAGIGTLIYLYSLRYMRQEQGRARYHSLLALTVAVLLCMVSSGNLLLLFICWQLLSWLLSFLAYNHVHPPTTRGAFRTFAMLRLGDVAFLGGIILAYALYGTLDFQPLFAHAAQSPMTLSLVPGWAGGPVIRASTIVTLLIFVGAMSKSAQAPLHMWLPDSLYAPTPVHALLHAGIINAGGFLINRLAPLYGASPSTLHVVFVVGLFTALLGAGMMLAQNDIKKTLGYSTIGQMGYMIMECGLGAFALAVFHLIAHGLFKATIFLNCGNVIHLARQEPRRPEHHDAAVAASPDDEEPEFSTTAWLTGFATTLILPLVIVLAAHGALSLPMRDSQGAVVFLFFSWVTSSQAILTLYRVRAIASRKVAALMLATLVAVVLTYLLAAEAFTYFLYPAPGEVIAYFGAAALPSWLFDVMVAVTACFVIVGWVGLYAKSRGRTIPLPGRLQVRLYLFLINRLYLDAAALWLDRFVMGSVRRLDQSRFFTAFCAMAAVSALLPLFFFQLSPPNAGGAARLAAGELGVALLAALTLPLFPFHSLYVIALTRLPGYLPVAFALLLPAAGWYTLSILPHGLAPELWQTVSGLALLGAAYGSVKALAQFRVRRLIAYSGTVLYALLWWHLAATEGRTPHAAAYAGAVMLATGGLLLAWHAVQTRFGNLDLNRIGGLYRTMPRFALLFALLVMAAAGLPPFGLFFGFIDMALHSGITALTADLLIVLAAWFGASWYLFTLLQRLLFGPPRADLVYEDLGGAETAALAIVLAALAAVSVLGIAPGTLSTANHLALNMRPTSVAPGDVGASPTEMQSISGMPSPHGFTLNRFTVNGPAHSIDMQIAPP